MSDGIYKRAAMRSSVVSASLVAGLILGLASSVLSAPKLKWLYASTGVYFDRWGGTGKDGNGIGWIAKNRVLNPPQTLTSVSIGGGLALTPKLGLTFGVPLFFNTFDEFKDRLGGPHEGDHRIGMGDFDIGLPIKLGAVTLQPQLAIPGPYQREYLVPWSGFGVYRGSLGLSYPYKAHSLWAAAEMVLFKPSPGTYLASPFRFYAKPRAGDSGLVETGNYALKGGYGFKIKLPARTQVKTGFDLSYTSFTWQPISKAQTSFSIDPKVSFSLFPKGGRELALSASATLYSTQGGEPDFRSYASRRIFIGAYWGLYY
jgi:hypothetical protein